MRGVLLAVLPVLLMATADAQSPGAATFRVYQRGVLVGEAHSAVARMPEGWLVTGTGTMTAAFNFSIRRFDARYDAAWQPIFMTSEIATGGASTVVHVAIVGRTTRTDIVTGAEARWRSYSVSARSIFLPEHVYAAYEVVAARLSGTAGQELPLLLAPEGERTAVVEQVAHVTVRAAGGNLAATHYTLSLLNPRPTPLQMWVHHGRLLRLDLPADGLSVRRSDLRP